MPAYYGGIIFLVAKFFTAFTDMLTGFYRFAKNIGPKGKFRPFILYAAVPAALIATLQFIATTFSLPVKTTIATALFMMFGLSYSLMNCSYGCDDPGNTKNPNERAQLAAYRQGGATIGLLICTVAFIPLQSLFSDSTVGYACAALMFSIGGFIFMMLCYRGVKEHYVDTTPTGHKASILNLFARYFVIRHCWFCALLTCVPWRHLISTGDSGLLHPICAE
ncbi:permease [Escherichia coli]|uniref:Permease n=1 Tax=Escherichia coli TaxID=562 RepID=A0A485JLV2_ECOLX|nr:permease [Escherichia coli]